MTISTEQFQQIQARLAAKNRPNRPKTAPGCPRKDDSGPPGDFGRDPINDALKPIMTPWTVIPGPPVPKPRMTQRDKFAKRPCVLRYREYCDRLRYAIPPFTIKDGPIEIHLLFYIAGVDYARDTGHNRKPDLDNLVKAALDALMPDDSRVWKIIAEKRWCVPGDERTEIRVL